MKCADWVHEVLMILESISKRKNNYTCHTTHDWESFLMWSPQDNCPCCSTLTEKERPCLRLSCSLWTTMHSLCSIPQSSHRQLWNEFHKFCTCFRLSSCLKYLLLITCHFQLIFCKRQWRLNRIWCIIQPETLELAYCGFNWHFYRWIPHPPNTCDQLLQMQTLTGIHNACVWISQYSRLQCMSRCVARIVQK